MLTDVRVRQAKALAMSDIGGLHLLVTPCFHLAARLLLPQHDRPAAIEADDVKRVLANIDADYGGRSVEFL